MTLPAHITLEYGTHLVIRPDRQHAPASVFCCIPASVNPADLRAIADHLDRVAIKASP